MYFREFCGFGCIVVVFILFKDVYYKGIDGGIGFRLLIKVFVLLRRFYIWFVSFIVMFR